MKFVLILLFVSNVVNFDAYTQIRHFACVEYNFNYAFDKMSVKSKPVGSLPPSLNYCLMYKSFGIEAFQRKVENVYYPSFNSASLPSKTVGWTMFYYAGLNFIYESIRKDKIAIVHNLGVCYLKHAESVLLGSVSTGSGGWFEPVYKPSSHLHNAAISGGLRFRIEPVRRFITYVGIEFYYHITEVVPKQNVLANFGVGYRFGRNALVLKK